MSAWRRIKKAAAGDHCDFVTLTHAEAKEAIAEAKAEYGGACYETLYAELEAAKEEIRRLEARPVSEKETEPPPPPSPVKSNYWR